MDLGNDVRRTLICIAWCVLCRTCFFNCGGERRMSRPARNVQRHTLPPHRAHAITNSAALAQLGAHIAQRPFVHMLSLAHTKLVRNACFDQEMQACVYRVDARGKQKNVRIQTKSGKRRAGVVVWLLRRHMRARIGLARRLMRRQVRGLARAQYHKPRWRCAR